MPIPPEIAEALRSADPERHVTDILHWIAVEATAEAVLKLDVPEDHWLWSRLAELLPASRFTPELATRFLQTPVWPAAFARGKIPLDMPLPPLGNLVARIRSIYETTDTDQAFVLRRWMEQEEAREGPFSEATLQAAIEALRARPLPTSRVPGERLVTLLRLFVALRGAQRCTLEMASHMVAYFGVFPLRAFQGLLHEPEYRHAFERWFSHPEMTPSRVLMLLDVGLEPREATLALARLSRFREHARLRARLRRKAQGDLEILQHLALVARGREFRELWMELEREPERQVWVLSHRTLPLPLYPEALLPLLGASDPATRLAAIQAQGRLQPPRSRRSRA